MVYKLTEYEEGDFVDLLFMAKNEISKGNGVAFLLDEEVRELLKGWDRETLESAAVWLASKLNMMEMMAKGTLGLVDDALKLVSDESKNKRHESLMNQNRKLTKEKEDLKKENKELRVKVDRYENMTPEELRISHAGRTLQSGWRKKMMEKRLDKARKEVERLEKELNYEEENDESRLEKVDI